MSRLIEANAVARRSILESMTHEQATQALLNLHDLFWPPENPAKEWDAETVEHAAEIVRIATERAQGEDPQDDAEPPVKVTIYDAIWVERQVDLPVECPHCQADFTKGGGNNLREWDWADVKFSGHLTGDEDHPFSVETEEERGETYHVSGYWCGACGKQVIEGASAAIGKDQEIREVLFQVLYEARGE